MISTTFNEKVEKFLKDNAEFDPLVVLPEKSFTYTIKTAKPYGYHMMFDCEATPIHFHVTADTIEHCFNKAYRIIKAYILPNKTEADKIKE